MPWRLTRNIKSGKPYRWNETVRGKEGLLLPARSLCRSLDWLSPDECEPELLAELNPERISSRKPFSAKEADSK